MIRVATIEAAIEEIRQGRMLVVVDDVDRENEGDLVMAADMATPEAVNFMARYGRGLICLALTGKRVRDLGLSLMSSDNASRHQTAFTVSIEAKEGITTGISAGDRARTIATAIDLAKDGGDIGSPGHVFPLVARDGGVLVRAGHTESAVDIARLAGLNASGVICEIMNDDGTMARMPDLMKFAQFHGLKVATIADLIAYRLRNDTIVKRLVETKFMSRYGGAFRAIVYVNTVEYSEHLALVMGDLDAPGPVLVRMHAINIFDDVLGELHEARGGELHAAMNMIGEAGRGAIVLIRDFQPKILSELVAARAGEPESRPESLRGYGIGAQILIDLGIRDMILLSNTKRHIVGLEGYGLSVVEQRPIPLKAVKHG